MDNVLLNFCSDHWGSLLLLFLPALINACIFVYVWFYSRSNKTNGAFAIFVLLLSLAQASDGFVHVSGSYQAAVHWLNISNTIWCFIIPVGLLFAVRLTGLHKKIPRRLLMLLLFFPAILLGMMTIGGLNEFTMKISGPSHWISSPKPTLSTQIINVMNSIGALIIFTLLWRYFFRNRKNPKRRTHALLLATGFTIPAFGGIICEVIFPLFLGKNDIPLTTPLITVFSVFSFVAIKWHGLFDFSPKHQWQQIVESMSEGMIIVNNKDEIMYANDAFCETMGYSFSEIEGRVAHQLFLSEETDAAKVKQAIAERKQKKPGQYEIRLKTKSGKLIWILMNGSPYYDDHGKVIGSIGIQTNIQQLKENENTIRENEQQMKNFVDHSLLSIYAVDPETKKIVYGNAAFLDLIGYTEEEIGKITIYDFVNRSAEEQPTSKEAVDKGIAEAVLSGKAVMGERIWKTNDGKQVHMLVTAFGQNRGGKPCIYVAAQDITEIKNAQAKLDSVNKELETYIYKASHDLRTPLCSITGLINASKFEIHDERAIHYLKLIESLTQKLDNTLKTFVKSMTISDIEIFADKIDFEELVQEIAQRFEYSKGFSRLQITTDIHLDSVVHSNKTILESIFQNMIGNAVKYQNFNVNHSFLKIRITENQKEFQIVFEDNGIGIDRSMQAKVFDMYFRATDAASGSGLGLYLVKKGVEKLNGAILLSSEPGKGTSFTITFPKQRNVPEINSLNDPNTEVRPGFVLKKLAS